MTQRLKPIGVLGGMGPEATILLQQRLLAAVDAKDDSDHIPLLIDMNSQVPSRIDFLLRGGPVDPSPVLASMAKGLEVSGATALAMPCNTAHLFAQQIEQAVNIPLLNMVQLAAKKVAETVGAGGKVGVLASPATKDTKLFERAFSPYGVTCIFPQDQTKMLRLIQSIKADGTSKLVCEGLVDAGRECIEAGATALLVGCSEFSMIADAATSCGLPVIDTVDLLVDEMLTWSFG